MSNPSVHKLSRRERQIMDAVYALGQASAVQVLEALPDPPGLSSVRKLILILEEKGHLRHVQEGQHFLYLPTHPRQAAAKSAMRQVLTTFFGGDLETAVATLLSEAETELTDEEAARLSAMIERAKSSEREDRVNDSATCGTKGE